MNSETIPLEALRRFFGRIDDVYHDGALLVRIRSKETKYTPRYSVDDCSEDIETICRWLSQVQQ